jgi:CubicO group peptidase (beta-lactamase class C family)
MNARPGRTKSRMDSAGPPGPSRRGARLREWIEDRTSGRPYGCLVLRRGQVAAAWYGGGIAPDSLFEIGSIRKSFNSALVGLALERGELSLDLKAGDAWPEIAEISGSPRDRGITLHQLLSGTSGWLTPEPPGMGFRYNNAAFTAAERVVARVLGLPGDAIAPEVERRFKIPLAAWSWRVYHFDRVFTADNLENPGPKLAIDSTLEDLVKWGRLWLDGGRWQDRRLIPEQYIRLATSRVNPALAGPPYGYNWFLNADRLLWPDAPADSYGHAGFGTFKPSDTESRAYLWICPSLQLVAAMVTDVTVGFANDFLDIPNGLTAAWIGRVAAAFG